MRYQKKFAGNGMSRTAMIFKIASLGGVTLTIPQMNLIKNINPRRLERVYNEVISRGDKDNARFAFNLIIKHETTRNNLF